MATELWKLLIPLPKTHGFLLIFKMFPLKPPDLRPQTPGYMRHVFIVSKSGYLKYNSKICSQCAFFTFCISINFIIRDNTLSLRCIILVCVKDFPAVKKSIYWFLANTKTLKTIVFQAAQ